MAGILSGGRLRWLPATLALALLAACASSPERQLTSAVDLQQRAEQAYTAGDMPAAEAAYRQLTEAMPDNTDGWFRLANVYARMQQYEQAAMAYQHVLQRDPSHAKAWYNLGVVRLREAEAAFVQGSRTARADETLQKSSNGMVRGIAALGRHGDAHAPAAAPATNATPGGATTVAAPAVPASRAAPAHATGHADGAEVRP